MNSALHRMNGASAGIARMAASPDIQTEDLARHTVDQRIALYDFKANLQTFKAGQEMLGSLLNLRA